MPDRRSMIVLVTALAAAPLAGCGGDDSASVTPRRMADSLHAVMEADRTVYTQRVVNRLANEEGVIEASEHWKDDKALPLPAQMFRMGAEEAADDEAGFSYSLQSRWPINKQNAPRTDAEKKGLKAVAEDPSTNFYTREELGGRMYFTAVYPDKAVAKACVVCHNNHDDSPRSDFELGMIETGAGQ